MPILCIEAISDIDLLKMPARLKYLLYSVKFLPFILPHIIPRQC